MPARDEDRLFGPVREILLREWDPIGVSDIPEASDEYDRYARAICDDLVAGVDEFRLAAWLGSIAVISMGLRADEARDGLVARRLLALPRSRPALTDRVRRPSLPTNREVTCRAKFSDDSA